MKKITFILFFALTSFIASAQNLITNGGFENAVGGYTVSESTDNVLMRVANIYDGTNAATFPTATAATIAPGQWVKKALSVGDDLVKGVVTTTASKSGSSSLNLKIGVLATTGYERYINAVAAQKLASPLDNTKKYIVTFWAKQDATPNNNCRSITVMITDNTLKQISYPLASTVFLANSADWVKYSVVLDLPKFKSFNATADFATAFLGFGINTTYTSDAPAFTNYSGVLLDDISMTEYTGPTVLYVKQNGTGDGSSWANATSDIVTAMNQITCGEVRVAAGTYFPSMAITLKDSVTLKGGYDPNGSGTRNLAYNKTILDGNMNKRLILANDTAAPFYYEAKADGFILQNGSCNYGSAAHLTLGAVLENCIIRNNTGAGVVGAAVYFNRNLKLASVSANKNYQCSGALINCVVINNSSNGGAGAIYGEKSTLFSIINTVIANNVCTEPTTGTGGLYIGNSSQFDHVQNCIFYKNSGATVALNNIRNNSSVGLYAVLHNWFDNTTVPIVSNADARTICKNNYTTTNIANPDFVLPTSFAGATTDATQFTEIVNSNWSLKGTSGLLELGNSTQGIRYPYENMNPNATATPIRNITSIATDIIGSPRIVMTEVDLGAYEFNPYSAIKELKAIEDNNLVNVQGRNLIIKAEGKVEIYNTLGRLVYVLNNNESIVSVKIGGIYMVKVTNSQNVKVQKVLVQ
jgi:hypothetical protein